VPPPDPRRSRRWPPSGDRTARARRSSFSTVALAPRLRTSRPSAAACSPPGPLQSRRVAVPTPPPPRPAAACVEVECVFFFFWGLAVRGSPVHEGTVLHSLVQWEDRGVSRDGRLGPRVSDGTPQATVLKTSMPQPTVTVNPVA
jgi:hypothetical protein